MRLYLKKMRETKNLSQFKTATQIGISQIYYCYIEKGERQKDMSYSMMEKLATIFDVPIQTIIKAEADYIAQMKTASTK